MKSITLNSKDLNVGSNQKNISETSLENSLAQFFVAGKECIVVSTDEEDEDAESHSHGSEHDDYLPIGHIRLRGQQYLILTMGFHDKDSKLATDYSLIANILTRREIQIALQVANGKVNKQIAYQLHLSEWTVSTHLRRIYAKLGVKSRAQMVAYIMSNFL